MVDAGQQRRHATDVVAGLALPIAAAHHHVIDGAEVDLRVALHQRLQRNRGQVVGAHGPQRSLDGTSDWRTYGVCNHCFEQLSLFSLLNARAVSVASMRAIGRDDKSFMKQSYTDASSR